MLLGPSSPIHFLGMSEQGLFDIHGAGFCIFVIQNLPAWTRYPQVFQSTQNAKLSSLCFVQIILPLPSPSWVRPGERGSTRQVMLSLQIVDFKGKRE